MKEIEYNIYKDLIGKQFKYFARGPKYFDCLGLVYEIYHRLYIPLPHDTSVIDRKLRESALEEGKSMFLKLDKAAPGAIVAFRISGILNHIGIYLGEGKFIHIQKKRNCCVEKITDLKWKNRIEGFYKFLEK